MPPCPHGAQSEDVPRHQHARADAFEEACCEGGEHTCCGDVDVGLHLRLSIDRPTGCGSGAVRTAIALARGGTSVGTAAATA